MWWTHIIRGYSRTHFAPAFQEFCDGWLLHKREAYLKNPQQEFEVIGSSFAGKPFSGSMGIDQCVRIFTGAVVPDDADMVMLQERAEILPNLALNFLRISRTKTTSEKSAMI